ncbi:MAG: sigma-70 family RNA polymerase sigma factor [Nitrospinota bacterium]|nr:MAG: sigma-70 family RNA polymerase sigma factor [Nitrospinota bacterium]
MGGRTRGAGREQEFLLVHFRALFYTACKLTNDRAEAEDLVQETYLKAYRSLAQLEHPDQCKAWLFRILVNTWTNRKIRLSRSPLLLEDGQLHVEQERSASRHPWFLPLDPEETLLRKEMLAELNAALQRLPETLRVVVLLVDVQGMSYEESARILDIPRGTVMSRLYRARRMLEQLLGESCKGEDNRDERSAM